MNCHSVLGLTSAIWVLQKWLCSHLQQVLWAHQGRDFNCKMITEALEVFLRGSFVRDGREDDIQSGFCTPKGNMVQISLTQDRHQSFHSSSPQGEKCGHELCHKPAHKLLCLNKQFLAWSGNEQNNNWEIVWPLSFLKTIHNLSLPNYFFWLSASCKTKTAHFLQAKTVIRVSFIHHLVHSNLHRACYIYIATSCELSVAGPYSIWVNFSEWSEAELTEEFRAFQLSFFYSWENNN